MNARIVVGLVAVVVGCKGTSEKAAPPAAAGSGSGSAVVKAPAPKAPTPAALAEDPKARAAYRAGMRTGRKATDARQWSAAIAGFDQALAAKPGDARAFGERGFARLLDGTDLDGASRDLDRAAGGTKDTKLLSSIWFNRGLIDEKRGNEINATAAFVVANALRPTAAAKAKLAGKSTCPVSVGHEVDLMDHKPIEGADWIALAKATGFDDADAITTKEAAFELFNGERTEPTLPGLFSPHDFTWKVPYYIVKTGTGLRAIPLAEAQGGRCPGTAELEVVTQDATRVLISGTELGDGGYTFMCKKPGDDDGDVFECSNKEGAKEEDAGTACFGGTPERDDIVLDVKTGKVLLVLSQPEVEARAAVELAPGGVKLRNRGCDRIEPTAK